MLTKKDFEKLAELLDSPHTEHYLIEKIADYCASSNPRFDREKFYVRSGMRAREDMEEKHRMLEILEKQEKLKLMENRLRELTGDAYPYTFIKEVDE